MSVKPRRSMRVNAAMVWGMCPENLPILKTRIRTEAAERGTASGALRRRLSVAIGPILIGLSVCSRKRATERKSRTS